MKYDFDHTPDHRKNSSFRWGMADMPPDSIGMGTADLDFFCAPCIREALEPIARENCYNYRQHTQEYYDAVTGWYQRCYGLSVKKEWLSNVPSTIGAIRMAIEVLTEPGDRVIYQAPAFECAVRAVEGTGCIPVANPMKIVNGHYEIDFENFEQRIREYHPKVFMMINPHNPTGRVFTRAELERLTAVCEENHIFIVSDEVHSLVLYGKNRHTPLLAVNQTAKNLGVQIVSLSKGYNIMSLPHAIVTIANPEIREKWDRQITAFSFGYAVNSFAIAAVTSILQGKADEWMRELTAYLHRNMQEILRFIQENHLPLVPYPPEGSFLMWINCRQADIGTDRLDHFFTEKAHIYLDDGAENFGPEGSGFVRINFAVTNPVLKEALERIKIVLKK